MPVPSPKAMILAAGLGTRLRPLTLERPKALVPVANRAVIDRVIDHLKAHGIREVVVNAHHHHEQLVRHLDGGRPYGIRVEVRVEEEILGTGGGIRNTAGFWDENPFFVINGDTLTDIDLSAAYEAHVENGGLATMVLHDRPPFNQVTTDDRCRVLDIADDNRTGRLAFTGIHIIEPALLNHLPKNTFSNIIDCYRALIRSGERIGVHVSSGHRWWDIGSIQGYKSANRELVGPTLFLHGKGCVVHPRARLEDWAVMGDGCVVGEGARVRASVLWEGVRVAPGAEVENCVLTAFKQATGRMENCVL